MLPDFDLFFKGLVWNQTDPVIEAWQAYYTLESAQAENNQSKIAAALLKAKVLYRDSKAVTDPALMKLGDRIAEADRTWLWTRVMILLQKNRMTETKRVLETLPRPELPAPMKELRSIIDEPTLWLRRQKKSWESSCTPRGLCVCTHCPSPPGRCRPHCTSRS